MPRNIPRKQYVAVAVRRAGIGTIWWVFFALAVVCLFGFVWASLLSDRQIASHREYSGSLGPDVDPVEVVLPKGAIVDQVVVEEQTHVEAGQTLATLDVPAMKRSLRALEVEIMQDSLLRRCMVTQTVPDAPFPKGLSNEERDDLTVALQECEALIGELGSVEKQFRRNLSVVQEERDLVHRLSRVISHGSGPEATPDQRRKDARQALSLGLLRNRLDQKIATLETEVDQETAALHSARLKRAKDLKEDIRLKSDLRRRIQSLTGRPRVQAPARGQVVHVRSLLISGPATEDYAIIEMLPIDGASYRAHFELPVEHAEGIETGHPVFMRMIGQTRGDVLLAGEVSHFSAGLGDYVRVHISIDDHSLALLNDPENGLAFHGRKTASIVRVRRAPLEVLSTLRASALDGFLVQAKPWILGQSIGAGPLVEAGLGFLVQHDRQ